MEHASFQPIVLTPPRLPDPILAIAASRAGAIGVLDLVYSDDMASIRRRISTLTRNGSDAIGLRLHARDNRLLTSMVSSLAKPIRWLILVPDAGTPLPPRIAGLPRDGFDVLLECTSLEEAQTAEKFGFKGVIAKGNEAGGRVSEETAFILLQRFLNNLSLPVWAQGGIGLDTTAACYAAGAAGVVLDSQLLLTRESPIPPRIRSRIVAMDGSETLCLGQQIGECYRFYAMPGMPLVRELEELEHKLLKTRRPLAEIQKRWRKVIEEHVGWDLQGNHLWPIGQDACFAPSLTEGCPSVAGVLQQLKRACVTHTETARTCRPLNEHAPLGQSHGTRFPIVQGPMTWVSDTPAFAEAVAEAGALPFLALALKRESEALALLEETSRRLDKRPWGVGILGFVPPEIRREQLAAIAAFRPPFALIAGGRPDQARALERDGIHTYLHVPSPELLKLFLDDGAQRFVFEGRECGGHVGPRSSFVLWESMIASLVTHFDKNRVEPHSYHVLFAGGIHDSLSASTVAVLASRLVARGVQIGVLMGSAYLFTHEAVSCGAITEQFQQEMVQCRRTPLLETGPGHAVRCADSPFVSAFFEEKTRLVADGRSREEIRAALESLNLGRLRMATKAVARDGLAGDSLKSLSGQEQHAQGMYMAGQVAALRTQLQTIEDLHHEVSIKGSQRLGAVGLHNRRTLKVTRGQKKRRSPDIAIVGMSCLFPGAASLEEYWNNVLRNSSCVTEIPRDRWDWRLYYDPDPTANDKTNSKWGGFIGEVPFDPLTYQILPKSMPSIDPLQLLTLEAVQAALRDAGYLKRPFDRERTCVLLGGSVGGELGDGINFRFNIPRFFGASAPEILTRLADQLPEVTEDSFPGTLLNVVAGRVANHFDLGGSNYTVSAACASSLAALGCAVGELQDGSSDMAIAGGFDVRQTPGTYSLFSHINALSPSGTCRPFDTKADGTIISEGLGIVVLKRLHDAELDGDRIYAVIKGIAGSSDGHGKSLTAPRVEGQVRALQRAYAKADVSPVTIGLIEAHGTGTPLGDQTELESLGRIFGGSEALAHSCALGSVKSIIGHTKNSAGVAGLIKAALALHHKVLPPTANVETPHPALLVDNSRLYLNTDARPWLQAARKHPRRAGVNAFGFGGTNYHTVLEEFDECGAAATPWETLDRETTKLLILRVVDRQNALQEAEALLHALDNGNPSSFARLPSGIYQTRAEAAVAPENPTCTLALIAESLEDLKKKLSLACGLLRRHGEKRIGDSSGVYFSEQPLARESKIAFVFPGMGSQSVNMLRELVVLFPACREPFECADRVLNRVLPRPLSSYIYPAPTFQPGKDQDSQRHLTRANVAMPAVGAADLAAFRLMELFGVFPDVVAGHSYGEYVALCAAGVFSEEELFLLSEARGRYALETRGKQGIMAAVGTDPKQAAAVLGGLASVCVANHNAPNQCVISGPRSAVETAVKRFADKGLYAELLPVDCAFHSSLLASAKSKLARRLSTIQLRQPDIQVFSNTTGAPHPRNPNKIAATLVQHLVEPVLFTEEIEALYSDGVRIFVEAGSRAVLTGLIKQTLGPRPHLSLAVDQPGRRAVLQLLHVLGSLAAECVTVRLPCFDGAPVIQPAAADRELWLVNTARVRPLSLSQLGRTDKETPRAAGTVESGNGGAVNRAIQPAQDSRDPTGAPKAAAQALNRHGDRNQSKPSPAHDDDRAHVVSQFQNLMGRFLEAQERIMVAYLRGQGAEADSLEHALEKSRDSASLLQQALGQKRPQSAVTDPAITDDGWDSGSDARASVDTAEGPGAQRQLPEDQELTSRLVQLVSERTGYPPEILNLDQDMEGDLGIDSIKRVEILTNYHRVYGVRHEDPETAMGELTSMRTLRGVVSWMSQALRAAAPATPEIANTPSEKEERRDGARLETPSPVSGAEQVRRYLLSASEVPLVLEGRKADIAGAVILTDDERGVAKLLADQLQEEGFDCAFIRMDSAARELATGKYTANLCSPESVSEVIGLIRKRYGTIGGLVHLVPLRATSTIEEMNLSNWRHCLRQEVKALFYLAKELQDDLQQAAQSGGACVLAATAMGGDFGIERSEDSSYRPSHGGVTGLIKALARECAPVRAKVLDVNLGESPGAIVTGLRQELLTDDDLVEVGRRDQRRYTVLPAIAPTEQDVCELTMDSSWIVLIVGGARGITGEVARMLAEYRPTLLLAGRSPIPQAQELSEFCDYQSPRELRTAIWDRLKNNNESMSVDRVNTTYDRLMRAREIHSTLSALEGKGARVRYFSVDVTDGQAFGGLIDSLYETYGRIDAVIYGAGVIEDKLIRDKEPASFDRVFDTKADGAFILGQKLRSDSLKLLAFFASAAGRFGNRGQADYAAANEILNKLALYYDRIWPGRVFSLNWGPWAGVGMVSPGVQEQFIRRGISLISPGAGSRAFDQELRYGHKGEVEILLTGAAITDPSNC